MKVTEESSKIVTPLYEGELPSIITVQEVRLSIFDLIADDAHIPLIYAYKPPTPSNAALELGLRKVLSKYREFAGRFAVNNKGDRVILLNDEGAKVVEASASCTLDQARLQKPTRALFRLHQNFIGVKELAIIQLTRFSCGSLVVGVSTHHMVADGHYASQFLVAWGRACRSLEINSRPLLLDRQIFTARDPPQFEFEHRGVEFKAKNEDCSPKFREDLVMNKFQFDMDILLKIKSEASNITNPFTKFESLVAHIWRRAAKACEQDGHKWTRLKIAVHGLPRLKPRVPDDYFGNLVLWAYPTAEIKTLVNEPLSYAANTIHAAISKVNDSYFKSFIDFASCKVDEEGLVPKTHLSDGDMCLNFYVDSWMGFPFCDLDFGDGKPHIFTPTYQPWEGQLYLVPSIGGDGRIDVFLALNTSQMDSFSEVCYLLD